MDTPGSLLLLWFFYTADVFGLLSLMYLTILNNFNFVHTSICRLTRAFAKPIFFLYTENIHYWGNYSRFLAIFGFFGVFGNEMYPSPHTVSALLTWSDYLVISEVVLPVCPLSHPVPTWKPSHTWRHYSGGECRSPGLQYQLYSQTLQPGEGDSTNISQLNRRQETLQHCTKTFTIRWAANRVSFWFYCNHSILNITIENILI